jgi:hypothetical protein
MLGSCANTDVDCRNVPIITKVIITRKLSKSGLNFKRYLYI